MSIPDMPENYWPDVVVVGKDGNLELAFAITKTTYIDGLCKHQIEPSLDALRRCLWQAEHGNQEVLKNTGLANG